MTMEATVIVLLVYDMPMKLLTSIPQWFLLVTDGSISEDNYAKFLTARLME